jgi:multidrug resistance efflux pump
MTRLTVDKRAPRRRWLALVCLVGLAALAFSLAGAGWILNSHASAPVAAGAAAADDRERSALAVFCLGHVDVEGGVAYPYPAQPGRVVEVRVKEGQGVKGGEVLYRMDDELAQLQMEEAKKSLANAEEVLGEAKAAPEQHALAVTMQTAAVAAAKHDLKAAQILAAKQRNLVDKAPGISKETVEAAEEQIKKLELAIQAEENKLKLLQLKGRELDRAMRRAQIDLDHKKLLVQKAQKGLDECLVKAPCDGTVLRLGVQTGDLLSSQPKLPAMIFCPDRPRIVRAEVEQEWAGRVNEGQVATIQDETSSNGPMWTGKVVRVADWMAHRRSILPDPSQFFDIRTLECIIQLDPGQPPLRIGQRVRVKLSNG